MLDLKFSVGLKIRRIATETFCLLVQFKKLSSSTNLIIIGFILKDLAIEAMEGGEWFAIWTWCARPNHDIRTAYLKYIYLDYFFIVLINFSNHMIL